MAMVPWLMTHDGVTIQSAAQHFGITPEQCEKDLWLLVVCGLPGHMPDQLVDIQFWDDGRIHVIDPQTLDRPLQLSGDEVMSMLVALRLLAQVPGTHDRDTLYGLIHRLERSLEDSAAATVLIDSGVSASALVMIDAALKDSRLVELVYASGTDDSVSRRIVRPLGIVLADGFTYLEAFCHQAEAIRTFRLDRVMSAQLGDEVAGEVVSPESVQDVPTIARVEIDQHAQWVLDMYPFTDVSRDDQGAFQGDLVFRDLDWLVRIVLSLGGAMKVLSPTAARIGVANAAAAALAAYS
jgi:predicted DNA-binding transcriptional regulator YafY